MIPLLPLAPASAARLAAADLAASGQAPASALGYEAVAARAAFEALNDGAFDVLDTACEQSRTIETARRAMWAAYLKGAGPYHRAPTPQKAA